MTGSAVTSTNANDPQRTLVMGILNVTEDSFSDGGAYPDTAAALAHAEAMVADGADIIDVGGESTRPGATRVASEVAARVTPVIEELSRRGIATSIDTMRASTARAAWKAGVTYLNDVSGGLADPDMLPLAAESGLPIILMHWNKGNAADFAGAEGYHDHGEDIVGHVIGWLEQRIEAAEAVGVTKKQIYLDPGIGFAKSPQENWQLLGATERLVQMGYPVLVGASRKRFLTALRPASDGNPGTPESADDATAATSALAAAVGAWAVRVHKVAPTRAAVDVAHAMATGRGPDIDEQWRARRG
ncbi:dihydropteroate synthase [Corynebacterium jeikeium]|uniref:Dihydropteroate synthase n=2 Tax=Corynebacterium jeikeium TaxID=38289 RepID=Q4JXM5_CORJK|nr:dihydropteroate synthase [Corynebacterium jeikeium K411]SUY83959.1 dihydropteroate synthase [Corynebacterium jeikeium]